MLVCLGAGQMPPGTLVFDGRACIGLWGIRCSCVCAARLVTKLSVGTALFHCSRQGLALRARLGN